MQVVFERRFAADRLGLAIGDDGPVVAAMRGFVHPRAETAAKVFDEQRSLGFREVAYRMDAKCFEPRAGLGADAVDFAYGERPDAGGNVGIAQYRNTRR